MQRPLHSFDCHTTTENIGKKSVSPDEFLISARMPLKEQMRSSIGNKCLSYSGQMKPFLVSTQNLLWSIHDKPSYSSGSKSSFHWSSVHPLLVSYNSPLREVVGDT